MATMHRHTAPGPTPGPSPTTWEAEALADRAEEVRAWFVQVRGGAPFLSAPDARVLADWLDDGVPVPTILRAVEATAAWRRAKRLRGAFTLKSCQKWMGAAAPGQPVARVAAEAPDPAPPGAGIDATTEAALAHAYAEVRAALDGELAGPDEALVRARCARVRAFHEHAWTLAEPLHAALIAEEATALGDLAALMDAEDFRRVCEEAARHRWRARFADISIEAVCAAWEDTRGVA